MIQPNNLPQELVDFLKDKNILEQFMRNCIKCKPSSTNYPNHLNEWISQAFIWRDSPESSTFWGNLNSDWYQHCKHIKK